MTVSIECFGFAAAALGGITGWFLSRWWYGSRWAYTLRRSVRMTKKIPESRSYVRRACLIPNCPIKVPHSHHADTSRMRDQ